MASDQPSSLPPDVVYVAPSPARPHEPPLPRPRRAQWSLLDPFTARHARSLAFQLVGFRQLPEAMPSTGYGLAFGESLATVRGAFTAGALQEHELRLVPSDALSLTLSRYQWEAGPRLGPLEPQVRVGFAVLHLDAGSHGFSFGMFSPRVGAGVWFKLTRTRIGVSFFAEYFWRWVGDDSAFVRGLTLEIQPTAPPLRKPRATSSPSAPKSR